MGWFKPKKPSHATVPLKREYYERVHVDIIPEFTFLPAASKLHFSL
jgi:hypothetical protein